MSSLKSPLNEQSRTYYADTTAYTAGGIFVAQIKQCESVTFKDAQGQTVVMHFKAPA